jgi:hypothetical protein
LPGQKIHTPGEEAGCLDLTKISLADVAKQKKGASPPGSALFYIEMDFEYST